MWETPTSWATFTRLIAFDLDGTLIDSRRDLADSANQLIDRARRARPLTEEQIGGMVGEGAALLVRRGRAGLAAAASVARTRSERFLEIYDQRLLNHTAWSTTASTRSIRAARQPGSSRGADQQTSDAAPNAFSPGLAVRDAVR